MMQATDFRKRDDCAGGGEVYRTGLRAVLGKRQMRSRLMVISKIRRKHATQVTLVENDHVVETLATDRANDALDVGVLPR